MDEIRKECESIIDEVCEKYNYSTEDVEGNDSLRIVLLKAVPAMLKDSPKEDRELFYQMLSHTPIVVCENLTLEKRDKLIEKYIGNPNPHIEEEDVDRGEYGKKIGAGSYVSEPIIDENLQIKGKKSFIYVQKLMNEREKEFLGTDINVSHLIHEIGHAWHAEKEQYTMTEDGILINRVGTAEMRYSFEKTADNKFVRKNEGCTGLFIEEGMNTIAEEKAMANYMGISLEKMKKDYGSILISSQYQGSLSNAVEELLEKTSNEDFEKLRMYGAPQSRANIEELIQKTEIWKNREQYVSSESKNELNYDRKREKISKFDSPTVKEFFEKYENLYFPDVGNMTPLEKIDNVLEQFYNLNSVKYDMYGENAQAYGEVILQIAYEIYPMINEAAEIKQKEEVAQVVAGVRGSEIKEVVSEIEHGMQNLQQSTELAQEGESRDEE